MSCRGFATKSRAKPLKNTERTEFITDVSHEVKNLETKLKQNGFVEPKELSIIFKSLSEGKQQPNDKLLKYLAFVKNGDVAGYTNLISYLAKMGLQKESFAVFEKMKSEGVEPNNWTFTALISSCEKNKDKRKAMKLLGEMNRNKIKGDAVTYTCLIKCFDGRYEADINEVLDIVRRMKREEVEFNLRFFDALINLCSGYSENLEIKRDSIFAKKNKKQFKDSGHGPKEMKPSQRIERVIDVLERMNDYGMQANIFVFNSVFRCYYINGQNEDDFNEAIHIFEGLHTVKPTFETYQILLGIACRLRYRDKGLALLERMKKEQIEHKEEFAEMKNKIMGLPLSPEASLEQYKEFDVERQG